MQHTATHGWLIYAWGFSGVLLVSALGRIVLFFVKRDAVSRFDVTSGLLSLAAIPALLGFAYHRPSAPAQSGCSSARSF